MLPILIRSVADFHAAVQLGSTPKSLVLEFKRKIDGSPTTADTSAWLVTAGAYLAAVWSRKSRVTF